MDAKLLNPYLVTSMPGRSPSAQNKDFTDYERAIHPDGPLTVETVETNPGTIPCAKYQRTVRRSPETTVSIMHLYNGDFTQLLVQNAKTVQLDRLFAWSGLVQRFGYVTRTVRADTYWAPARRIRRLVQLKPWQHSHDRVRCVESIAGPGLSLSSWPPSSPFLHNAARMGCAAIVGRLLDHYACFINARAQVDQGTALHVAAYYGHLDVVKTILQRNPDTTIKNKLGETSRESAIAGQTKYKDLKTREDFYPMVERAHRNKEDRTWIPDKKLRLGTEDTEKTHPLWKFTNWDAIIALLGGRPSNP